MFPEENISSKVWLTALGLWLLALAFSRMGGSDMLCLEDS